MPPRCDKAVDEALVKPTGILLAQAGRAATRKYRDAMAPIGLNPRATAILLALRAKGYMTQQALGTTLDIDASNLVSILNELEARDLIKRQRDIEDRRRHFVAVTYLGHEALERVTQTATALEDDFFAALSLEERHTLRELLLRVAHIDELGSAGEVTEEEPAC